VKGPWFFKSFLYKMHAILEKASRDGESQKPVHMGGRLHDSAIGGIYYAKAKINNENIPAIVKTIDMAEQNVWAVVQSKKPTVRGLPSSEILFMEGQKEDVLEWKHTWCDPEDMKRPNSTVAKVAWLEDDIARDGATRLWRLNEYLNEGLVGLAITKLGLPNVVKTYDLWISKATGFILQEYGGASMLKSMCDLTLPEFKSIVVQILATLSLAQDKAHFKHHDVHLDNIFINRLKASDVYKGSPLNSKDTWCYVLSNGTKVHVKHCGILAKIGDYGLASITDDGVRYERVDMPILDATEIEWGQWSGSLEGQGLYDAVVFLSKFFLPEESGVCPHSCWIRQLFCALREKWPIVECSIIGRPLRGHEGSASIAEFLSLDIFKEFHAEETSIEIA